MTPGNTDVGFFERRRVVDTVTGDGDDRSLALAAFDDDEFLLRRRASEHDLRMVCEDVVDLSRRHVAKVAAVHHARLRVPIGVQNTNKKYRILSW